MDDSITYADHPLIQPNLVEDSPIIHRHVDPNGNRVNIREIMVGDLVMINPDPRLSRNPTSDSVWLGVPTWFEAGNEGSRDEAKRCEVWWMYGKAHLLDLCRRNKVIEPYKTKLKDYLKRAPEDTVWISDHFSDEPVESIMTVPSVAEIRELVRLGKSRYLHVDIEKGIYELVKDKSL